MVPLLVPSVAITLALADRLTASCTRPRLTDVPDVVLVVDVDDEAFAVPVEDEEVEYVVVFNAVPTVLVKMTILKKLLCVT